MNIPQTFRPKEKSGSKVKELLEGRIRIISSFDYTEFHAGLYFKIDEYLKAKVCYNYFNLVLYLSDSFKENRFAYVKEIVENRIDFSTEIWNLFDCYKKLEKEEMINILEKSISDKSLICIIYTSKEITEIKTKDDSYSPFFDRTFVMTLEEY